MNASALTNTRVVLASRPQGAVRPEHFRVEQAPVPAIADGEMLLETRFLSLDPYMRLRMNDGPSYAEPVQIGAPMCGGTVCRVVESRLPAYQAGDQVLAFTGWQQFAVSNGEGVMSLDKGLEHPSYALGILGMPGFTAYHGLLNIGQPRSGETVVVAAATGAVGSAVGQIAKIKGCRTVGVAGGADKCRYAVEALGFDACVDHTADDLQAQLAEATSGGIDVYFENVGGAVFDAVLPLLKEGARIPLCGVIAWYDSDRLPEGPNQLPGLMRAMLVQRIKMQGFVILDEYERHYGAFLKDMRQWLGSGQITVREDVVDGLESAPDAFIGLLHGRNFGKLVVRVASV
ncbi:MAG: NADP-dependent oxidoreductase [Algiphilus sp.]